MQQVSANVYVETKIQGCNPGFVTTSEGVVMIDTPHKPTDAVRWRKEIAARGKVRYIVLTEHHADHVTTSYLFSGTVIAQQGMREVLKATEQFDREMARGLDPEGARLLKGYFMRLPGIAFAERLTLYLGDHTFELIHLPGHTAHETAVYIPEERVVFTGDNVFYKVQTWFHEADPEAWLESLRRIGDLDVDVIVPGHGEVCDKGYLKEQASFIQEWMDTVRKAIKQGLSKEEAQARISFLDRYPMDIGLEAIGPAVQQMNVGRLYDLLSAK